MHLPKKRHRAGSVSERAAAVRILLLKGLPRVSAGAAQVTGEEAALWCIAFGMPESGNYHWRSEPFTIPSWSIQPNVCPNQRLALQGEIWGALMDKMSQMRSFCLSLGLVLFWLRCLLKELAPTLLLGSRQQSLLHVISEP